MPAEICMVTLLSIIVLGFFLGMRHATDPDHVIAIATIVSRQRSIRQAAVIGILWGLGHTITILIVGSSIILFGLVIPPRIGLSMEFSVGLMLILLGVLNLSGMMRWITETFTPMPLERHPHSHAVRSGKGRNSGEAAPAGWFENLRARLLYGSRRTLRPVAAMAMTGSMQ